MIVVAFFTAIYQVILNQAFRPLFRYLLIVFAKTELSKRFEFEVS